ncbi:hypothetical protein LWC33_31900 [Pseudonocardia sp. RS11V-5]|uniref:hypothetical protein n=1 Tax=Pseudonocardia terrae TaxID=2905831 RepID=UPI001E5FB37F|nr:hypothetical protein [Pseudonocardia terrae]MCE3556033.1 hypothetical protein [Pseudonocardia terrae]
MPTTFMAEPELPEGLRPNSLDADVRRDLRGLQKETADKVALHLVAAGMLVDEDPEAALEHARYARKRASRIAVVREAAGIAAYHAGEWNEALGELRAARRMGGGPGHIPVMADIERALGRPERALELARGPEAKELGHAERIELAIVAAGARRDLGELDAAVVGLQGADLDPRKRDPWSARLFYAYADNLLAAGREADAVQWFVHATDADAAGETDARRRLAELTGEEIEDEDDGFAIGDVVEEDDPTPTFRAAAEDDLAGEAADVDDEDDQDDEDELTDERDLDEADETDIDEADLDGEDEADDLEGVDDLDDADPTTDAGEADLADEDDREDDLDDEDLESDDLDELDDDTDLDDEVEADDLDDEDEADELDEDDELDDTADAPRPAPVVAQDEAEPDEDGDPEPPLDTWPADGPDGKQSS